MTDLKNISTEDLKAEILRRERLKYLPIPKHEIDWSPVIKMVEGRVEKGESEDFEHFLYETVMEAIYGDIIWDYLRGRVTFADREGK